MENCHLVLVEFPLRSPSSVWKWWKRLPVFFLRLPLVLVRGQPADRQTEVAGRKLFYGTIWVIQSVSILTKKKNRCVCWTRLAEIPSLKIFCRRLSGSQGCWSISQLSRGERRGRILDKSAVYRRATLKYKHPLALTFTPSHSLKRTLLGPQEE